MENEQLLQATQEELNELLRTYRELSRDIKQLEKEKDNVKANILIQMKMASIEHYENEMHSVKYTMQERKVLDKNKLEAFLGKNDKTYEEFVKINQYEMLRVIDKKNTQIDNETEE
jgi:hypothetical protein